MAKKHSKDIRLSRLGEFGLIQMLRRACKAFSKGIIKGIGDDAAVVSVSGNRAVISSDMMLEGVHFNLAFTTFYQLGCKIMAVNLSDIFAMGGNPKYFLLSIGIPGDYKSGYIEELYKGAMEIAGKFGVAIVGGDTCASKRGLILCGAVIGEAAKIITRSGARPGDGIFVTDTLGDSAMGLRLLKKLRTKNLKLKTSQFSVPSSKLKLIKRHLMPAPQPLKNTRGVTSMIDISDGLLVDLSHICDESGTGAVLYKDKIPLSNELIEACRPMRADPARFALTGGEDYVLLFTSPGIRRDAFRIGEIVKKGRFLIDSKGRKTQFKAEGYEHFKEERR